MKKLLALFAVIAITISAASAQDICFRGGLNLAKHIGDASATSKAKFGVNLGATVDFELIDDLYFRPGLMFTMKGAKYDTGNDVFVNQNYFEVPFVFAYKLDLNGDLALDFQTGPFVAVGFCGKIKNKTTDNNRSTFKRNGNDEYHRFDLGWNLGIGVDVDQFYFGLGYDWSFLKLRDDNHDHWKQKNGCFMFNFGYYL